MHKLATTTLLLQFFHFLFALESVSFDPASAVNLLFNSTCQECLCSGAIRLSAIQLLSVRHQKSCSQNQYPHRRVIADDGCLWLEPVRFCRYINLYFRSGLSAGPTFMDTSHVERHVNGPGRVFPCCRRQSNSQPDNVHMWAAVKEVIFML